MSNSNDVTWSVIPGEDYKILKLNGRFDEPSSRRFEKEYLETLKPQADSNWVINCQSLSEMTTSLTRSLLQFHRDVKNQNKKLRLILVCDDVKTFLISGGLSDALSMSPSLREALVEFGLATKKAIDVNFINPFLSGTMSALKIQANIDAVPGKIFRQDEENHTFFGDISGVIGLVSEAFSGSVVISFPEQTFLKIMSTMLGEEFTTITKDIGDGAGELTNIIFGQAKVILNEKGYALKTAIPSVIMGKDHKITALSSGARVVVPFTSDAGDFYVEICVSA